MKTEKGPLTSSYHLGSKYLPSPQNKELILNYFKYNNFQDFNTWQQIAKTKLIYSYEQLPKNFTCSLTLKWEDNFTPSIHTKVQTSSKKTAKRKALTQIVEALICQGYIARGFKEQNFIDKLPRRRKHQSDESGQEGQQQQYQGHFQLLQWLEEGNYLQVFNLLASKDLKFKQTVLYQSWNHALQIKSVPVIKAILKALSGEVSKIQKSQIYQPPMSAERQLFDGSQVKQPLPEDLTDFISSYQLSKDLKPACIRKFNSSFRQLPSENVLIKACTHSPTREQLLENFHPIQASTLLFQKQQPKVTSFLKKLEGIELPVFEREQIEVSVRFVELLHSLLLFYCQDYSFCLSVLGLLQQQLKRISINFSRPLPYQSSGKSQQYYIRNKNVLTAQFLQVLSLRAANYQSSTSIEGILMISEQKLIQFKPKEPEEIVNIKIKKNNFTEFQQSPEICNRQMVLLVSKITGTWVAQVIQLTPNIRLHVPAYPKNLKEPHPVTLIKLCNPKLFQKTSSALIEASINCMELFSSKTFLLWQPPTYPQISVIAELLIQWLSAKQNILILTPHLEELHSQLTSLGFKATKLSAKTEQKLISKNSIVVSGPGQICCDLLRNYAFSRVLVESAQAVSQVSLLCAVVKDCKQLWLMGDPFLPKMQISSNYCLTRKMNLSLFQRLFLQGKQAFTYVSKLEQSLYHSNVLEWVNENVYSLKLNLLGQEQQLPIVKGFPWPSFQHRICFLHEMSFHPQSKYLNRLAEICSLICQQVVRSGYTKPEQIGCSSANLEAFQPLKWHISKMLQKIGVTQNKLLAKLLNKMVRLVSGSRYMMTELQLVLVGAGNSSLQDIIGGLLQGRRGVIFVGDCQQLSKKTDWSSFLGWCKSNHLIMTANC